MTDGQCRDSSANAPAVPRVEMLVAAALFAVNYAAIRLTRQAGGIALVWPGNAIAAAILIRLPRVRWASAAVLLLLAVYLPNVLEQRALPVAGLFALINVLEIALLVVAFRFVIQYPYPNITVEHSAIMTAVFGVAIPGVCAIPGGLAQTVYGAHFLGGTREWWSSHALGACLFGPPLILCSRNGLQRLVRNKALAHTLFALLVSIVWTGLAIRYVRFPFALIAFPLLVSAFRFGGFGTSILSLCSALTVGVLWDIGVRPFGLDDRAAPTDTLVGLPVIAILVTVMPPIAVGLGVDGRRTLLRALRASEQHFRTALQHSPIGILIADLKGIWDYTNIALQKMLGYTAEELRALPPGGPSSEADWEESKARWGRLVRGEMDYYDIERRFQRKDGKWIWTHLAVALLRDADGNPAHLITQIESIEARRHAEERLAAEREKLRITLHSISEAVVTTDVGGYVTYINAAAESLLGLGTEFALSRRIDELLVLRDPHTSKTAVNLIAKTLISGKQSRRETPCELHRPDGSVTYVTDVVAPVADSDGHSIGLVIVFRDATADIARERELRRSALHDALTGLYGRAEFLRQLRMVYEKSLHLERPAAVMAIDLDRFKAVNDAAGHAGGDAMLRKVADVLRSRVRSTDTVARLGGDEFAIVLDNCTTERALAIGQQLSSALNPLELQWDGKGYAIGASIGIAMTRADLQSELDWLDAADKACYLVKGSGRGDVRLAP